MREGGRVVAGARVGLIGDTHDEVVPWESVHERVAGAFDGDPATLFGRPVDVVVHGGTHQAVVPL